MDSRDEPAPALPLLWFSSISVLNGSTQWCSLGANSCAVLVFKSCPTLVRSHGLWPTRLLCPLAFPGKNPGVGCGLPFSIQGICSAQESNPLSPALAGGFFTTEPPGKLKQLCNCPWKGKAYPQKTTQGGINTRLYRMTINTNRKRKKLPEILRQGFKEKVMFVMNWRSPRVFFKDRDVKGQAQWEPPQTSCRRWRGDPKRRVLPSDRSAGSWPVSS